MLFTVLAYLVETIPAEYTLASHVIRAKVISIHPCHSP